MDKSVNKYVITNEEMIQLEKQLQNIRKVQKQLEQHFDFEIPTYIVADIAENETYNHICLMINVAKVNERLSKENAKELKEGLKELLQVTNNYDNVESKLLFN